MDNNNDPDSEYAEHFDTVPVVIVSVPSWHWDIHPDDYADLIKPLLDDALAESTDGLEVRLTIQNYQIGSAAEWSRTLAIVVEHAGPTASFLASLVTIAPFALRLVKKFRNQNDIELAEHPEDEDSLPPRASPPRIGLPLVIGLAGMHYMQTYGSLDDVSINWFTRATDRLGSIGHPSGRETYVIKFTRGNENIVYHVTSEGRCTEHYYLAGGRMLALEIPNWLDEDPYHHPRQLSAGRVDERF